MRYMEKCADWPVHSVNQRYGGVAEADSRLKRSNRHLFPVFQIGRLSQYQRQKAKDSLYGGQSIPVGLFIRLFGGIRFDCVGQGVEAGSWIGQ